MEQSSLGISWAAKQMQRNSFMCGSGMSSANQSAVQQKGFVTGHGAFLNSTSGLNLVIPYGSRHDTGMKNIFLQLR